MTSAAPLYAVWKFPVMVTDDIVIPMPQGAKFLHAEAIADDLLWLWFLCNTHPAWPRENRRFRILGTGHPFVPSPTLKFRETVVHEHPLVPGGDPSVSRVRFVWHIFED